MDDVEKSFVALVADALDTLKYGRKSPASEYEGARSYRYRLTRSEVSSQLRRVNEAIAGARTLKILSAGTPKFSRAEISSLAEKVWALQCIENVEMIEYVVLEALRERGISDELLTSVGAEAAAITAQMREGAWK